jgi:hypothetical protein
MKYRGDWKIYFEAGIRDEWERFEYKRFVFQFFLLKKKPPEGEMLRFWRDYIGINYESNGWHKPSKLKRIEKVGQ